MNTSTRRRASLGESQRGERDRDLQCVALRPAPRGALPLALPRDVRIARLPGSVSGVSGELEISRTRRVEEDLNAIVAEDAGGASVR